MKGKGVVGEDTNPNPNLSLTLTSIRVRCRVRLAKVGVRVRVRVRVSVRETAEMKGKGVVGVDTNLHREQGVTNNYDYLFKTVHCTLPTAWPVFL
jgi:hypothetical protein